MKPVTFEQSLRKRTLLIVVVQSLKIYLFLLGTFGVLFYLFLFCANFFPKLLVIRFSWPFLLFVFIPLPACIALALGFFQRQDTRRLTLMLEQHYPHLRDRLLTAMEFSGKPEVEDNPFSKLLSQSLQKEMVAVMDRFGFGKAASFRKLIVPGGVLLGVFLIMSLHALAQPGFFTVGLERLIKGFSSATYERSQPNMDRRNLLPKKMRIQVVPGTCKIQKGTNLKVFAKVLGDTPEQVELYYRTSNETAWQISEMKFSGDQTYEYVIAQVLEPSVYFVKAEAEQSSLFQIELYEAFALEQAVWNLEFPEHTGLPKQEKKGWREKISVQSGAKINLTLTLNRSVRSGQLVRSDGKIYPFVRLSERQLSTHFECHEDMVLKLDVQDETGEKLTGVPPVWIHVTPDLPPFLEVLEPQMQNYVFPDEEIPFVITVNDDHGIGSVTLVLRYQGKEERIEWLPQGPASREVKIEKMLELEKLPLQSRDILFAYLEATDISSNAKPQIVKSSLFVFVIRNFVEQYKVRTADAELPSLRNLMEDIVALQEQVVLETWDYLTLLESDPMPSEMHKR